MDFFLRKTKITAVISKIKPTLPNKYEKIFHMDDGHKYTHIPKKIIPVTNKLPIPTDFNFVPVNNPIVRIIMATGIAIYNKFI
ncbi:MAG: hypothetical protein ACI4EU_06910 [Butyrivibrio sp.]